MRSPFPGMDPYLEPNWLDVHSTLIAETKRELNRSLPSGLVARIEERVAVYSGEDHRVRFSPDVLVYKPSEGPWTGGSVAGAITVDAPYCVVVDLEPVIERYLQIVDFDGHLVTIIEFISPANKRIAGLEAFTTKREELLAAGVHVVEIDLVRAGNWKSLFLPHVCPADAVSLYRGVVRTAGLPAHAFIYPIHLRDPLPEIQIPLRPNDPKQMLSLQPLIETLYTDGRYGMTLDYTKPLEPALSADDQRFAAERIAAVS